MTLDEMKERAKREVESANLNSTNMNVNKVYENLMDGTLITIAFQDKSGNKEYSHVHFRGEQIRFYRYHSDVLNDVSHYKERNMFFRFLEFAGVGGLIACMMLFIFTLVLSVLAFSSTNVNPSIVEVIKLSFTIILGYFFGQLAGKK